MAKDKIRPLLVQIGGDTGPLTKAFDSAQKDARKLQDELKEVDRGLKFDPSNTVLLAQKQKLLAESITATSQKLEALKSAEEQMKGNTRTKEQAEQYRALQREIETTKGKLDGLTKEYGKLGNAASRELDKISEKTTKMGKALTPLSAAVAAIGTAAIASYKEVDEGMDKVITATGATGQKAEELEGVFNNVASSIAADFDQIGGAIGEINTRFGYLGDDLEACSQDFLKFARVNSMDATESVRLVSRAMGDAGIDANEYKRVLDMLTKAAQDSGIQMSTLAENLARYGAPMRQLGFDTEETIAMFSGWEKAGVNTEVAFSGMRQAIGKWSKEGKDASKEFQKMLDKIKNAPTLAKATTKSIEIFGQKAGPDLADAIREGRFEFDALLESIKGSQGTLDATFDQISDGLDDAKTAIQSGKLALASLGKEMLKSFAPILKSMAGGLKDFAGWFKELDDGTKRFITTIGLVVAAAGPLLMITGSVSHGISALITLYTTLAARKLADAAASTAAATAQTGLNTAMAANPAGMVALGIATLVATVAALALNAKQAEGPLDKLNKQIKDEKETIQELKKSQAETLDGGFAEINYIQQLWSELKTLTNAQGVVIGNRERAKFITEEINKIAPDSIKWLNNERIAIEGGAEAIDLMIAKKRAQIILEAKEPEYKNAILNLNDKEIEQSELQLEIQRQQIEVEKAYQDYQQTGGKQALQVYQIKANYLNNLSRTYQDNQKIIEDYYTAIDDFENGSAIVASDNLKKIQNFASGFDKTIQNSTKLTKDELVKRIDELDAAARRASEYAEQSGSEAAKRQATEFTRQANELRKQLYKDYKEAGKSSANGYVQGVKSGENDAYNAGYNLGSASVKGAKAAAKIKSPSRVFRDEVGKNMVLGLVAGIRENMRMATKSMAIGMRDIVESTGFSRPSVLNSTYVSNVSGAVSNTTAGPTTVTEQYYFTIDAKNVQEFTDLVRMAQEARQMCRAYG